LNSVFLILDFALKFCILIFKFLIMSIIARVMDVTQAGYSKALDMKGVEYIVPFGCPGDTVEVDVKGHGRNKKGIITKIIEPSSDRVEPKCSYAGKDGKVWKKCGGCAFQYISYEKQLKLKRDLIKSAFLKKDVLAEVKEVLLSPQIFGYRNRMDFIVGPNKEIGLREKGSFEKIIDIEKCELVSSRMNEVLASVRKWIKESPVSAWNYASGEGILRYIILREMPGTHELAVIFITYKEYLDNYISDLRKYLPSFVTHIFNGLQDSVADISFGNKYRSYLGGEYLSAKIKDIFYLVSPGSFFQTNSSCAELMLGQVLKWVSEVKPKNVLDLYCGGGFFSLAISKMAGEVCGVELDKSAIDLAIRTAEYNKIKNVKFVSGDVLDFDISFGNYDLLVVDPPRVGLHPKVISRLMEAKIPNLIYVSCNFDSLAYNLSVLGDAYEIEEVQPIDMFPHTPHVETLVKLRRK